MENRIHLLNNYCAKAVIGGTLSIMDLREKEFNGEPLTMKEKQALVNYDAYRIAELNAQTNDRAFNTRYRELQVMANMESFDEFLKPKYFQ
jgi:hypothetical protein